MHPNPAFRHDDRALLEAMIDEIGFGTVFATTPDGPRVAHTPLIYTGNGVLRFHLSRGNALTKHLGGMTAVALVGGPDGYISPRWYSDPDTVPTWNYVVLELEGRVQRMDGDGLLTLLEALSARHEARVSVGEPWTMDKLSDGNRRRLMAGIVGFEMEVLAWRPTFKLSQNKDAAERERIIAGLEGEGALGIAQLMRTLAA